MRSFHTALRVNDITGDYLVYTRNGEISSSEILLVARSITRARFVRGKILNSPAISKEYFVSELSLFDIEVFGCLFLDNRHRIIAFEKLFYGTIDATSVYPREVLKRVLALNANAVIFSHNHPAGSPEPSDADLVITERLVSALELINVRVLDHIIVGGTDTVSLAERGDI